LAAAVANRDHLAAANLSSGNLHVRDREPAVPLNGAIVAQELFDPTLNELRLVAQLANCSGWRRRARSPLLIKFEVVS
jgi:hypothetical protein